MKSSAIFAVVVIVVFWAKAEGAEEHCYLDAEKSCKSNTHSQEQAKLENCNARYGAIVAVLPDLQSYAVTHIIRSIEYLMMSIHFDNYVNSRKGFAKLFRRLSDEKWDTAIDIIKYITKRGGQMNFNHVKEDRPNEITKYELFELESLAKALDIEKRLAMEAHAIHGAATRRRNEHHDPEVSSYVEKHFVHQHSKAIRMLAGHVSDLDRLLNSTDFPLGLQWFDEYLQQ